MKLPTSAGSNLNREPTRTAVIRPFFTHWYRVFSWQRRMAQTSLTVRSSIPSNSRREQRVLNTFRFPAKRSSEPYEKYQLNELSHTKVAWCQISHLHGTKPRAPVQG